MEPMQDFAQLQLQFVDQIQWRYELIRPLVLFAEGVFPFFRSRGETRGEPELKAQQR